MGTGVPLFPGSNCLPADGDWLLLLLPVSLERPHRALGSHLRLLLQEDAAHQPRRHSPAPTTHPPNDRPTGRQGE